MYYLRALCDKTVVHVFRRGWVSRTDITNSFRVVKESPVSTSLICNLMTVLSFQGIDQLSQPPFAPKLIFIAPPFGGNTTKMCCRLQRCSQSARRPPSKFILQARGSIDSSIHHPAKTDGSVIWKGSKMTELQTLPIISRLLLSTSGTKFNKPVAQLEVYPSHPAPLPAKYTHLLCLAPKTAVN
jgi:hypothetical protein